MIVFPMAGLSSRFFKAGYDRPKYKLRYGGKSVFQHVVEGFSAFAGNEPFLFICRSNFDTPKFVCSELSLLGLNSNDYDIIILEQPTRGQAETVAIGLQASGNYRSERLTIFNVDTVRHGFSRKFFSDASAGYLEVFVGEGDHWSFVLPEDSSIPLQGRAKAVREKERISPLCSNGLYEFEAGDLFMELYSEQLALGRDRWGKEELFVAPLYQLGLQKGIPFHYSICQLDQMDFCGIPSEYEELLNRFGT
ncbi:hypothetical protein [Shimia thalassica]|uniref:hypothetical protein n=1 Tax=Shimia thalassica TaxID=1715693 RepID=UPI0027326F44|nr:hypothetical protein [Shimia thalassica]MDP2520894.1 hypothetical protein [Shimia thalassica]